MSANKKTPSGRPPSAETGRHAMPDWYGWLGVLAMLLLIVVEVPAGNGVWRFPMLSLGEWLLLPLGMASLSMGLLVLPRVREKNFLPLWLTAIAPAVTWLIAEGLAIVNAGFTSASGDLILSWVVRLIFPVMAFVPLLANARWRDRLMWALTIALSVNVLAVMWRTWTTGLASGNPLRLNVGGLLANQHDFGLMLAVALPLVAAWRGGGGKTARGLAMIYCMFLLPCLSLAACNAWGGVFAAGAGLLVCWTAWRGHAWILGIFLSLLVFGAGSEASRSREHDRRALMAATAEMGSASDRAALEAFVQRPFLGNGPEGFTNGGPRAADSPDEPKPWYAFLLGGSGLAGLGMWFVILAELAARALGRDGRRDQLRSGGVLGGTIGLAAAGVWTSVLVPGGGAMVGLLLAISMVEDPIAAAGSRRLSRERDAAAGQKRVSGQRRVEAERDGSA